MSSTSRCVAAWRRQGKQNSDSSDSMEKFLAPKVRASELVSENEEKTNPVRSPDPYVASCSCCFFPTLLQKLDAYSLTPRMTPLVCFMCLLNILLRFTDIYTPSFAIPTWRLVQDTLRFYVLSQCWKSRKRSRRSARWPLALQVFNKTSHQVSHFCTDLAIETRNKSGQVPQAQEQVFPSEVIKIDVKVSRFMHWDSGLLGKTYQGDSSSESFSWFFFSNFWISFESTWNNHQLRRAFVRCS